MPVPARKSGITVSLLALFALLATGCGGEVAHRPAAAEDLTLRRVWRVPGYSQDQLFDAAREWMSKSFAGELDLIQYANRQKGILMGRTLFPYRRKASLAFYDNFDLRFTIMVEVRPERVRTTFMKLRLVEVTTPKPIYASDVEPIHKRLLNGVKPWIESLKAEKKDKNW